MMTFNYNSLQIWNELLFRRNRILQIVHYPSLIFIILFIKPETCPNHTDKSDN